MQVPCTQKSNCVQALPSLHAVPSGCPAHPTTPASEVPVLVTVSVAVTVLVNVLVMVPVWADVLEVVPVTVPTWL